MQIGTFIQQAEQELSKMKFFLPILLLSVAVAMTVADPDEDMWSFYKANFGKRHGQKEEGGRRTNFINAQRRIERHNRFSKGWQMSHNKFSDMSEQEKNSMLGAKPTILPAERFGEAYPVGYPVVLDRALPTSIDYRTSPCMPAVKNQGQCGSCWSFASVNALEFSACKKNNNTAVVLSEQMLVDCDIGYGDYGCNGGFYTNTYKFLKAKGGIMKSTSYPYTGVKSTTCKYSSTAVSAQVSTYGLVSPRNNTDAIMAALDTYGPLPAALMVFDNLYNYATGVYSEPLCKGLNIDDVNHAVVIVGYGATTDTPAVPYWIVRNSWGTGWGLGGYFNIRKGVNMCNIESLAAFVSVV